MNIDHNELAALLDEFGQACQKFAAGIRAEVKRSVLAATPNNDVAAKRAKEPAEPKQKRESKPTPIPNDDETGELTKLGRKILVALAQVGGPLDRAQLGVMTGMSPTTGPFGVELARLRRQGLIDGGGKAMLITAAGRVELGEFTPLPTGHALFEYWTNKLGRPADKILRALRSAHGKALSREDLGAATGLSFGTGPFGVALALLRRMQLIKGGGKAMTLSPGFLRAIEPTIGVFDKASGKTVRVDARGGHAR